mgnify:CR=1 FL=1
MKIGPIAIRSFIMLFGHIKWHTKRWFDRLHSGWRSDWMRSCQYCFRFRAYESSDPTIRWRTIRANSEWEAIKLEESRLQVMWHLEQKQRKMKAFVDQHWKSKEKLFDIGKSVLMFQTKIGYISRWGFTKTLGKRLPTPSISRSNSGQSFSTQNTRQRWGPTVDQPIRGYCK